MKYSLLILPLLASAAFAQDDVWKTVKKGDRVQITFRSGNMISGNLDAKPADPRIPTGQVDYAAASEITIDVSLEYPGLNGTLTVPKKEIKEVRVLQNLDPATMKKITEEMKKIQAQINSDEDKRKAAENDRDKAAAKVKEAAEKSEKVIEDAKSKGAAMVKEFKDIEAGQALLARFPPDKWGDKTIGEIADKAARRQPITPDEREFSKEENLKLWRKALEYNQKEEAEKNKEKSKEKVSEK